MADDLDDLLDGDSSGFLEVDAPPLQDVDDLLDGPLVLTPDEGADVSDLSSPVAPTLSMVSENNSSILHPGASPRLGLLNILRVGTRDGAGRLASRLLRGVQAGQARAKLNVIEERLTEEQLLNLAAELKHHEVRVQEGMQVALILGPPTQPREEPAKLLARHLNATPIDGMVVVKLDLSDTQLRQGLLKYGLTSGRDYELVEGSTLLPEEREIMDRLISKEKGKLRLIRRMTRKRAKTPPC